MCLWQGRQMVSGLDAPFISYWTCCWHTPTLLQQSSATTTPSTGSNCLLSVQLTMRGCVPTLLPYWTSDAQDSIPVGGMCQSLCAVTSAGLQTQAATVSVADGTVCHVQWWPCHNRLCPFALSTIHLHFLMLHLIFLHHLFSIIRSSILVC